jgi:transposase-like protein
MRSRVKTRVTRGGGWRQWTEDEAREALAELAASGETQAAFSRRTGVSLARLAYWRKRVSLPETTAPNFVAVALGGVESRQLEIVAEGVVVRVREDLDVDQVARLVEAIGRRMVRTC